MVVYLFGSGLFGEDFVISKVEFERGIVEIIRNIGT